MRRAAVDVTDHGPAPADPAPNVGELLLAVAPIVFGALIVWQTTQIRLTPAYAKVGPRAIPYLVGGGLVLIGVWLALQAWREAPVSVSTESEDVDPTLPTDWRCLGTLVLMLIAYLVLLEPAGFAIASTVLFAGAAAAMGSRRFARDIAIGVIVAVVLYVGFTRGLGLQLPPGVLQSVL